MNKLSLQIKTKQVFALLKKDIVFNYKFLLLGLVSAIVWPFLMSIGELSAPALTTTIISPFLGLNLFLGKVLYNDDTYSTRIFLQALPVKKTLRIFSKYLMIFVCIVVFELINLGMMAIARMPIVWNYFMISLGALVLFYSLTLFLFHKYNYDIANKAVIVFILLFTLTIVILQQFTIDVASIDLMIVAISIFIISLVLYFVSLLYSIKKEGNTGSASRVSLLDRFRFGKKTSLDGIDIDK